MGKYYVFVDNSNVWIEGKFASAVAKGWAGNLYEAHQCGAEDTGWRIDFGKLLGFVVDHNLQNVKQAILFGSRPPHNDTLWDTARSVGFEVTTLDRNSSNKEKAVDTGIVQRIDRCLYRDAEKGDTFILVAGDKDFIHSVRAIRDEGMIAKVYFWNNASGELKAEADSFCDLMPHINAIEY